MTEMLVLEFFDDETVDLVEVPDGDSFELQVRSETTVEEVPHGVDIVVDGPPMVLASGYVHTQASPAATWTINHNLGQPKEPVVLLDSNPTKPVWTDVEHGSVNQTTITFPSPVTGKAYF